MSGRSGRRIYSAIASSSGSQHDLRPKRKETKSENPDEDAYFQGGGDAGGKGKSEEVRISRLTRLLVRLDNEESFFTICGQIEGALNEAENQKYVCRCFQCLCPSFLEVFKGLGGLPWEAAGSKRFAQLLSKICQAMEKQTSRFFQWMVDIIVRTSRGSQTYVSTSAYVMESVSIQLISLLSPEDIIIFMKCVYDVLEDVSNPRVFRVLGAIFVCGTNSTSSSWKNPHFQDFIDMVVGWMVDVQQSQGQLSSCSELLENSKCQFLSDLGFLVTLMGQLLEDLEQAIKKVQPTSNSGSEEFLKVLQLIRAYTCLLSLECPVDKIIVTEFCDRLVVSTLQFIRMSEPHKNMDRKYRYELLTSVNKSLFYAGGVLSPSVTKYFRAQLKLGSSNSSYMKWPKLFFMSFLESVAVWIEAAVSPTQLPEEILEIGSLLLSLMDDMQDNLPAHDLHYVLNLVVALLRTRNLNLLQKAYGWLLSKLPSSSLKKAPSRSVEEDNSYLFVLVGLADIASNKGSSILSLWALNPSVFETLVDIAQMDVHHRTRKCALELLKTHCLVHSHFVSSIASTGAFNTDSPGTRFLPALMDFWLQKLKLLPDPQDKWIMEWVFEFLQNNSNYAALLYQANPEFYEEFLRIITQKSTLFSCSSKILEWFCNDSGYLELEPVMTFIRGRLIVLLLDEKLPIRIKEQFKAVLYQITSLVLIPEVLFVEDCVESDITYSELDREHTSLTSTEFNLFLHELLIGNNEEIPHLTPLTSLNCNHNLLSIAADHLIRLKLKTPLGKPQDFFGQLLLVFKKSRLSRQPVPVWKLHLVFELEKKFQLWIHGSATDETDLTEHVKTFYLMNKSPFLEWLKRIRTEIIETCMLSKELPLAYFNAALMGDTQKMEFILFKLQDSLGLKGMGNLVAHHYLEGKYEEALKLIGEADSPNTEVLQEVKENSKQMLDACFEKLQTWSINETVPSETGLENILQQSIEPTRFSVSGLLNLQLENRSKLEISILGDDEGLDKLKLPTMQKIFIWLLNTPSEVMMERKENFETIWIEKLLQAGNLQCVKSWMIKKDLEVARILSDEDLSNTSLTSVPVATLKICADYFAKKLEYKKSVILYNVLRELVTGSMDSNLASKITLSLCDRILESEEFFNIFCSESLSHGDRLETITSLHQVALQSFPECAKSWEAFGNFAYSHSHRSTGSENSDTNNFMKYTAVECYVKYIQLSPVANNTTSLHLSGPTPRLMVMTRLLQLFRGGFKFQPDDTITSSEWLVLLAEISQIPELRPYIVEKYPDQAAMFMTSHHSTDSSNKCTARRRNLFDLAPYAFVDTSEEPLSSSVILSHLNQLEKQSTTNVSNVAEYDFKSNLSLPNGATVFAHELLNLASSMEDMWAWSLERIAVDWSRRLAYLRKECSRSMTSEKIQIFIQPVVTYLNELLSNTVSSQRLVDINFTNRHKQDIQKYISAMSASCSLDDITLAMNSFLKYSERFGMLINNKLPVSMFSQKLADSDFYADSGIGICLPGQPQHIKISNIHPVVHALPTKTKPKRIRILANNGKYYDYLVKGTENLNIDCGVMQFLKVVQSLFSLSNVRTYSVTPLGKRGGLIQIVPDAVPLFSLYKKHLQRNKSLEKTSEMFWGRMNALGYDDRSSLSALREVYETLCSETSCDLITRELLLAAETPSQWLNSVQTFTKDCSIGAAVGYLLGIGDRHLDNMLVNVKLGKFIHVDFSIIFGKGATLRVPERVPFRLTQNIASVLQYPGPAGVFSVLLQETLSMFQKYKETAVHLINNIAFSQQYDEDPPVDLTDVLLSELDSVVKLFLCRLSQDLSILQALRLELQEMADNGGEWARRVSRKMNKWRRMLVNLNTVLQFITTVAISPGPLDRVTTLVHTEWTKHFQLCLELAMEQNSQDASSFLQVLDVTENLLTSMKLSLASDKCSDFTPEMVKLQDSNIQIVDLNKVDVLVKYSEINIQSYNPNTTVKRLVDEATSVDNLSQMYEGWTAWV